MSVIFQSYFVKQSELPLLEKTTTFDQLGELRDSLELAPALYDSSYTFVLMQFGDDLQKWLPSLSKSNQVHVIEFAESTALSFKDNNRYYRFNGECLSLDAILFRKEELFIAKMSYDNLDIEDLKRTYPRFPVRIRVNREQFTRYLKSWYDIVCLAIDRDAALLTFLG